MAIAILAAVAGQLGARIASDPDGAAALVWLMIVCLGLAGLIGVALRPDLGVLLLVALLTTNASEIVVRALAVPSPLQWLTVAVAAGLGLRAWRARTGEPTRLVLDPLLLPLSLYLAVVFTSSLVASEARLSDERLIEHLKGVLVFLVVTNAVRSRQQLRKVVWATVLSGALLGTISLFQVATGQFSNDFLGFGQVKVAQIVGDVQEPRIAGPLADPNFYAQLLVALVPLALARAWDEGRPSRRLLAAYALLVITAAAIFTYSRGGAIALALVMLLALLSRRIGVRTLLAGLAAGGAVLVLAPSAFTGRLTTIQQVIPGVIEAEGESADSSFRQRRLFMATAWEMFKEQPLLGVGAGNYSPRYEEFSARVGTTQRSFEKFGGPYYPHSTPFELLAETGLAGFLAYAAIILAAFAWVLRAVREFRLADLENEAHLTLGIGLGLVGYLVTSALLHGHYVHYFWLLITLVATARQVSQQQTGQQGC